jgi:hypothetical protein
VQIARSRVEISAVIRATGSGEHVPASLGVVLLLAGLVVVVHDTTLGGERCTGEGVDDRSLCLNPTRGTP